jgi:hypothetical protein
LNLFSFYIGGKYRNSNIELHDIRFSVGEKAEDCYEDLRRQWWGDPESLHLDCWGRVNQADGFDVTVTAAAVDTGEPGRPFGRQGRSHRSPNGNRGA